jgi:transcriptional regulator with XRE-family HTH domain
MNSIFFLEIAPIPKLFQACIDGRKRGIEKCLSVCSGEREDPTVSFEVCKKTTKNGKARPNLIQWCRTGYDEMIVTLEAALAQQASLAESELVSNDSADSVAGLSEEYDVTLDEFIEEASVEEEPAEEASAEDFIIEDDNASDATEDEVIEEKKVPVATHRRLRSDDAVALVEEDLTEDNNDEM